VSDTPRTDKYLAQRLKWETAESFLMSWQAFAQSLERDLRECVAALKLAYPILTDKAAKEEIGALLNSIEAE
jgi:hypothetical protein